MRHVLRLATTLALVLGMAATGFAVVNPNTKLKPTDTTEKQTAKKKPGKSSRHAAQKLGYKSRTSALRVPRLSQRQRKEFYRRMLDIYIN